MSARSAFFRAPRSSRAALAGALASFGLLIALATNGIAEAAAPAFKTGSYEGKTSPVYLVQGDAIKHVPSAVGLLIEPMAPSACGGAHATTATVLCLMNGLGGPFGGFDTRSVNGRASDCSDNSSGVMSAVNAGWTLAAPVPASGIVHLDFDAPGDSSHIDARFVVHASGSITGTVTQLVNVSTAATKGKAEPLCTTGTWTFDAKFQG